jgi:ABC-2 type transport system permease protein
MKRLELFKLFFRLGFMSGTEYRINFFIHLFEVGAMFASGLSVLWVVFSRTPTVAGWTWNELLVVMGLYFVGYGGVGFTVGPSVKEFMTDVWKGTLDFLLVKPEDHQFLASTRKVVFWNLVDITMGAIIVVVGLVRLGTDIGFDRALLFIISLSGGGLLIYSFWICLATLSFWTTRLENLMLLYYHLYEAGRWPVAMYPAWLRYSLTFIVPIAFAITVPAEAAIGRLSLSGATAILAAGLTSVFLSRAVFHVGIRKYTSASS